MKAYQDIRAKTTGTPNTRGAEDLRQLQALVETMTPDQHEEFRAENQRLREMIVRLRAENNQRALLQTPVASPRVPGSPSAPT